MKIVKIIQMVFQTSRLFKLCFHQNKKKIFFLYNLRSDQISIIDDLAFDMYQDPEIGAIIKNLDRKKQECVHGTKIQLKFLFIFLHL